MSTIQRVPTPVGRPTSELSLDARAVEAPTGADHTHLLHVSISPADAIVRRPIDVCLCIDVSGSMGMTAGIQTATDGPQLDHGLSVLDVVKHASRTVIESLTDHDSLAVIGFNSNVAPVLAAAIPMDRFGKDQALNAVEALTPRGATNLWAGLEGSIDAMQHVGSGDRNSVVMVLTDGQPTNTPPRGHEAMLEMKLDASRFNPTVSTFGFGYGLDSKLLLALSEIGGGTYGFIPDAGMVGTIFVHALANSLSSMHGHVTLSIETEGGAEIIGGAATGDHDGLAISRAGWGVSLPLGPLLHGQSRDIVLRAKLPPGANIRATVETNLRPPDSEQLSKAVSDQGTTVTLAEQDQIVHVPPGSTEALVIASEHHRLQLVQMLGDALGIGNGAYQSLEETEAARLALAESMRAVCNDNRYTSSEMAASQLPALLEDVEGQIREAVSRQDWWDRWGQHYLRSLRCTHLKQQANNFKDAGVQAYGGKRLFSQLRDEADSLFMDLPPPKPSVAPRGREHTRLHSMATFHSSRNPCFHGDTLVFVSVDGIHTPKPLRDLKKGDLCVTPGGGLAALLCLVRTQMKGGKADLVRLPGDVLVTPWHPVRRHGATAWEFPSLAYSKPAKSGLTACDSVYSFLLDGGEALVIANSADTGPPKPSFDGIGWAHGIQDDAVAAHEFFGGEAVVKTLAALPGFEDGFVDLDPDEPLRRCPSTGLVIGLNGAAVSTDGVESIDVSTKEPLTNTQTNTRASKASAEALMMEAPVDPQAPVLPPFMGVEACAHPSEQDYPPSPDQDCPPAPVNHTTAAEAPSPAAQGASVLRCKVSSDLIALDELHAETGWTPGSASVRPNPTQKAQKDFVVQNLCQSWSTLADWISAHVFGQQATRGKAGDSRKSAPRPSPGEYRLHVPSYPYETPEGTSHGVFWYVADGSWDDNVLTEHIGVAVDEVGGADFVWYENPKKTVEDPVLEHVQVFWRS